MSQIITAIFENGVLKPEQPLALPPGERVQIVVVPERSREECEEAWKRLEQLHKKFPINSGGDRMTRDQLHERR